MGLCKGAVMKTKNHNELTNFYLNINDHMYVGAIMTSNGIVYLNIT